MISSNGNNNNNNSNNNSKAKGTNNVKKLANKRMHEIKEDIIEQKLTEQPKLKVTESLFKHKKEKKLINDINENARWKKYLDSKLQNDRQYIKFLNDRKKLPAYLYRDTILKTVNSNQFSVICGETGCGKSTQIPQFILEHYLQTNKASLCSIIVTQPRRISAIGLADRVSQERSEVCGKGHVGYSIRLENKKCKDTKLLYCTTGILLRRLMSSLYINSVSHVIIVQ